MQNGKFLFERETEKGTPTTRIFRNGVKVARVSHKGVWIYPDAVKLDILFDRELMLAIRTEYSLYNPTTLSHDQDAA